MPRATKHTIKRSSYHHSAETRKKISEARRKQEADRRDEQARRLRLFKRATKISAEPTILMYAIEQSNGEIVLDPSQDGPRLFSIRSRAVNVAGYYLGSKVIGIKLSGLVMEAATFKFRRNG